jgi:hypothetical protein
MRKKDIYNPITGRYYKIKTKTTKYKKIGQIRGLWSINNSGK